jgi:hypothetical protein
MVDFNNDQFKQLSFPGFNMSVPDRVAARSSELDSGVGNKTEISKNAIANSSIPDSHLPFLRNTDIKETTDAELNSDKEEGEFRAKAVANPHSADEHPNSIRYAVDAETDNAESADLFPGLMVHEAAHILQPKQSTSSGPGTGPFIGPNAYLEGSAEGYRLAHDPISQEHGYLKLPTSRYTPEFFGERRRKEFSNPENETAVQSGRDAAELFGLSKQFSAMTGDPGFHAAEYDRVAHDMVGVLPGERRHDFNSKVRMFSAQIGRTMNPDNFPHMQEFKDRHRAAFGQTVQGSMFPSLVPEKDQFGDAPMEQIPRSEQGEVMYAKNVEGRKIKHSEDDIYRNLM